MQWGSKQFNGVRHSVGYDLLIIVSADLKVIDSDGMRSSILLFNLLTVSVFYPKIALSQSHSSLKSFTDDEENVPSERVEVLNRMTEVLCEHNFAITISF